MEEGEPEGEGGGEATDCRCTDTLRGEEGGVAGDSLEERREIVDEARELHEFHIFK